MSIEYFEDPAKLALRQKVALAIDNAGYQCLPGLEAIPLPYPVGVTEVLIGDVQAIDTRGIRHVYVLRPNVDNPLPTWIQNLARAAAEIVGIRFFVVIDGDSRAYRADCRVCGAGLLRVTDRLSFDLLVEPSREQREREQQRFSERVGLVIKQLTDAEVNARQAIDVERSRVLEMTVGFGAERSAYLTVFDLRKDKLDEWKDELSRRIDRASSESDDEELKRVESEVLLGYQGDEP